MELAGNCYIYMSPTPNYANLLKLVAPAHIHLLKLTKIFILANSKIINLTKFQKVLSTVIILAFTNTAFTHS